MDFDAKLKSVRPQPVDALPLLDLVLDCDGTALEPLGIEPAITAVATGIMDKAEPCTGTVAWTVPGTGA